MRTDGTTDVLPLSKVQKMACNIAMGVLLLVASLILILAGTDVIDVSIKSIAAPTLLFGIGLGILFSAIIAKNSLSMWLAGVVLTCGFTSLLAITTSAGYENLYPLYIAAPAIGFIFSMPFADAKFPLLKAMGFFGGIAAVFSLQSSGTCGWGLTCGILAAFGAVCVILYAIDAYFKKDNDENA